MQIHSNIPWYYSCGATVIGLLSGKHPSAIESEIVKYRRKHSPKKDDHSFTQKFIDDKNYTYWSELRYFLRKKIGKNRTVDIWDKNIKLKDFADQMRQKGWFIVLTKNHVQIINDMLVYDCNALRGEWVHCHVWKNQRIICYVRLNDV